MLPPHQVPSKLLHTAPEVDGDGEPPPKKLCAPPPSSDSNPNPQVSEGSKAPPAYPYRCLNCTEECYHYDPATCDLCPMEEFLDSGSDDESESGEYEGEKDGLAWVCLRCATFGRDCSFDHGGKSKGFYLSKSCLACDNWGHWTSECPHETNSNTAAADHADHAGEQTNNTSAA